MYSAPSVPFTLPGAPMRQPSAVIVWQHRFDSSFIALPVYGEEDERTQLAGLRNAGMAATVFVPDHARPLALVSVDDATGAERDAGHSLPESQRHRTVTL